MKIQCKEKEYNIQEETKIEDFINKNNFEGKNDIIAAFFNNEYVDLESKLKEDGILEFIDISSKEGNEIYRRTIIYILAMAFERKFPEEKLSINYQLTDAMYCEVRNVNITEKMVKEIAIEMKSIIENNYKIYKEYLTKDEALKIYKNTDKK